MPEESGRVGRARMPLAASSDGWGLGLVVIRPVFGPGRIQCLPTVFPFPIEEETPLEDFFRRVARFGRIPELVP